MTAVGRETPQKRQRSGKCLPRPACKQQERLLQPFPAINAAFDIPHTMPPHPIRDSVCKCGACRGQVDEKLPRMQIRGDPIAKRGQIGSGLERKNDGFTMVA